MALMLTTATLTPAMPAPASPNFQRLMAPPTFYHRVAKCETNSDWQTNNRRYTSGFGLTHANWQKYSNASNATNYTPRQQALVLDRFAFSGWTDDTGVYQGPNGPWGFGVVKANCMNLQRILCRAKNPLVKKWARNCK